MKLNKKQKITIIAALFAMTIVILFPPVAEMYPNKMFIPKGRDFLFSISSGDSLLIDINTRRIGFELLGIALAGSALIIWFGLGKKEKGGNQK